MGDEGDWIRLYRDEFSEDDLLWSENRERTRWEAWLDLRQRAAWKDHETTYRGTTVTVRRGQLPISQRRLRDRWRWTRGKVRRFLELLEEHNRISTDTLEGVPGGLTMLTITDYGPAHRPNRNRPTNRPTESLGAEGESEDGGPSTGPKKAHRPAQTEEGKEEKEVTTGDGSPHTAAGEGGDPYDGELPPASQLVRGADGRSYLYPPAFEATWEAYPSRHGSNPKKGAYAAWRARAVDGADPDDLLAATRHYADFVEQEGKVGTEYVAQAQTFFGHREPWMEYRDPPDPPEKNGRRYDRL